MGRWTGHHCCLLDVVIKWINVMNHEDYELKYNGDGIHFAMGKVYCIGVTNVSKEKSCKMAANDLLPTGCYLEK